MNSDRWKKGESYKLLVQLKKLVLPSGAAQAGRSLWAQAQDGQKDPGDWDRLMGQNVGLWVGTAHQGPWLGRAGQGCGDLETGPAAASLGQGLTALGGDMESCAVGRWGEPRGEPGKLSEVCSASRTPTLSVTGIFIAILDFQYIFFPF